MACRDAFDAFVDAERLVTWWPEVATTDPRPGGSLELGWPSRGWILRGSYVEVVRPTRVVFTWSWDHEDLPARHVAIDFTDNGETTSVTITHGCDSQEEGQSYIDGWQFFISRLSS